MPIIQSEFQATLERFSEMEEMRDQLWNRARRLLKDGYEIEAFILILATWNFARFRYLMKGLDLNKFQEVIDKLNPLFAELENLSLQTIDLCDDEIKNAIMEIYRELKGIVEQTGASKIMALKNPDLLPMWDTAIRKKYKIANRASPDDFIDFLKKMKEEFKGITWRRKKPFAKAIDEYNYVKTEPIRRKKKKGKREKKQ